VSVTLSTIPEYDASQTANRYDQAVVIGAGFAGLCAARVLADYFSQVVILERDSLPHSPNPRGGVPQGPHAHTLFPAGARVLNNLFPGYGEDLLAAGGVENDSGSDWSYHYKSGGVRADTSSRIQIYNSTRSLFEQILRYHVAELSSVTIYSSHSFLQYVTTDTSSTVTGVTARSETGKENTFAADLVVDAMGRASKTPRWLEDHGYSAPPKREMQVDVAYSTGYIERPPDDIRGIIVEDEGRSVGLTPVEDAQWQFWLTGRGDDHPPKEARAMERFAEDFCVSTVMNILEDQEWCDRDIAHYRFLSNQRYRYEEHDRFPDGLIIMGDAIASFNPVFGQGMTVAILESLVLHHVLANSTLDGLSHRFFQRVKPIIDLPWFIVTAFDSTFSSSSGPAPAGASSYLEYQRHVRRTSTRDGKVAEALLRTTQLERPLSSLLNPNIVHRVFDEPGGTTSETGASSAWEPVSLTEVGPVLEENLSNPKGVLKWPGITDG